MVMFAKREKNRKCVNLLAAAKAGQTLFKTIRGHW